MKIAMMELSQEQVSRIRMSNFVITNACETFNRRYFHMFEVCRYDSSNEVLTSINKFSNNTKIYSCYGKCPASKIFFFFLVKLEFWHHFVPCRVQDRRSSCSNDLHDSMFFNNGYDEK